MPRVNADDVAAEFGDVLDTAKHRTTLTGRTGRIDPLTGQPEANPSTGLPANRVWFREDALTRTDPGRLLRVVWNYRISNLQSDAAVEVDLNSKGEYEVVGFDITIANREYGAALPAMLQNVPPPELNKSLLTVRNIMQFRPRVGDSGGLQMYVEPGWYGKANRWNGGNIVLVPTATASSYAYVVVGFDEVTGALVQALGPDYADVGDADQADITATFADATFADARPIAAVLLANGATSFTNNEIVDLRDLTAVGSPGSSGTPTRRVITFASEGALATQTGTIRIGNHFGATLTILGVYLHVNIAPTGSAIIVDVNKGGTTIFTTQANRPQIAAGANAGNSTTIDVASWADGEYLQFDIDQVGATAAGEDLTVQIIAE